MRIKMAAVMLAAGLGVSALAEDQQRGGGYEPLPFDPNAGYTMFSIPKCSKTPVIDGVVSPGEWDQAFAINAMGDQQKRPPWAYLYARWVTWRLMWDEDNVYICAESQRLPNENPAVSCRDQTLGGNTVMDDSYEIHVTPVGRNGTGLKLPWSAQSILNPAGVGFYSQFTWSVAARSTSWRPDWKIANNILPDRWVMELCIPRSSLDLAKPNKAGEPWSFLLARNWKKTGWNQSAVPGKYSSFGVPQEQSFGYLTDGAFAQLLDMSGLFAGDIRIDVRAGTTGKPEKAAVKLQVQELAPAQAKGAEAEAQNLFNFEKQDEIAVEPGKLSQWSVSEAAKLQPKKSYRVYLEITAPSSQKPLLKLNVLVEPGSDAWLAEAQKKLVAKPYTFSVKLAPMKSVLEVFADFIYAPDPKAPKCLEFQMDQSTWPPPATPEKKPAISFKGKSSNIHYSSIRDRFQLPPLTPGEYAWTLRLLDDAGKVLAEEKGKIEKKDEATAFPWFGFEGGRHEKVLWPYEPIKAHNGGERIDYWGGSFHLTGLALPRQVAVTANREWRPSMLEERPSILAREAAIAAEQDGKPAEVRMQGFPRTTSIADHKITMRGFGRIGKTVEVQSDAEFHQDGLLWINLTLRPAMDSSSGKDVRMKEAALDRLTVDIPFTEAAARLMVAHGQPGYGSYSIGEIPQGDGVVWDSSKVGRSVLTYGNILPVVWLGSDQRGLAFLAENNKGWIEKDLPGQQIIRRNGEVALRLNIVQDRLAIKDDHLVSFGFIATPVRKMVPGWRMLNCSFSQNFADSFFTGRNASQSSYYNSSYMPSSYQKSREMMFNNTSNMIYRGFEFAPHTEQGGYESRSNDWPAREYFGPEWSQSAYTREFQDHLLWNMQKWMDEGGLTGVYHDQFYPAAFTNSIAGAAYVLPDGRTNPGYNLLLDREFTMREHALMLENGIQPRIFCHTTNGGELYAYAWTSAILDGEDNMIIANADYDFVDIHTPARMQAYGNPWPWGNTFYWMRLIQEGDKEWRKRQDRAFFGWIYLHDVFNSGNGVDQSLLPKLLDWGMNGRDVKFWPYWRNAKILGVDSNTVLASMWTSPDRALLCLFNTDKKQTVETTVRVPTVDLDLMPSVRSEYTRAFDLETGEAVAFDGWNGAVTAKVLAHDYRLISINLYKD